MSTLNTANSAIERANGFFQIGTVVEQGMDGFEPEKPGLGWICVEIGTVSMETYWMRYVQPYASKEFGFAFYPEVGDQVLALRIGAGEYLCLGSLYTGKNVAKITNDEGNKYGKNFIKEIRTKAGTAITINDEDGKEYFQIDVKEGAVSVKLDVGGKAITVNGGSDTKNFDVKSENAVLKVTVKDAHVKAGDATIDIKSGKIDVKGGKMTVISNADITVKASGKIVIKGSTVDIC